MAVPMFSGNVSGIGTVQPLSLSMESPEIDAFVKGAQTAHLVPSTLTSLSKAVTEGIDTYQRVQRNDALIGGQELQNRSETMRLDALQQDINAGIDDEDRNRRLELIKSQRAQLALDVQIRQMEEQHTADLKSGDVNLMRGTVMGDKYAALYAHKKELRNNTIESLWPTKVLTDPDRATLLAQQSGAQQAKEINERAQKSYDEMILANETLNKKNSDNPWPSIYSQDKTDPVAGYGRYSVYKAGELVLDKDGVHVAKGEGGRPVTNKEITDDEITDATRFVAYDTLTNKIKGGTMSKIYSEAYQTGQSSAGMYYKHRANGQDFLSKQRANQIDYAMSGTYPSINSGIDPNAALQRSNQVTGPALQGTPPQRRPQGGSAYTPGAYGMPGRTSSTYTPGGSAIAPGQAPEQEAPTDVVVPEQGVVTTPAAPSDVRAGLNNAVTTTLTGKVIVANNPDVEAQIQKGYGLSDAPEHKEIAKGMTRTIAAGIENDRRVIEPAVKATVQATTIAAAKPQIRQAVSAMYKQNEDLLKEQYNEDAVKKYQTLKARYEETYKNQAPRTANALNFVPMAGLVKDAYDAGPSVASNLARLSILREMRNIDPELAPVGGVFPDVDSPEELYYVARRPWAENTFESMYMTLLDKTLEELKAQIGSPATVGNVRNALEVR